MLWIDHANYVGPDRRQRAAGLRLLERRRQNYAGPAPSLSIAMRQLRMHVIEAQDASMQRFVERLRGVALIARAHNEPETANILTALAEALPRSRGDMRQQIYAGLDRAHAVLRAA